MRWRKELPMRYSADVVVCGGGFAGFAAAYAAAREGEKVLLLERDVLGPVRVMGPCIAMGEAAGIAAHLAMHNGTSFRNVNVQTLKQMIRAHGGMTDRDQIRNGDETDAG